MVEVCRLLWARLPELRRWLARSRGLSGLKWRRRSTARGLRHCARVIGAGWGRNAGVVRTQQSTTGGWGIHHFCWLCWRLIGNRRAALPTEHLVSAYFIPAPWASHDRLPCSWLDRWTMLSSGATTRDVPALSAPIIAHLSHCGYHRGLSSHGFVLACLEKLLGDARIG